MMKMKTHVLPALLAAACAALSLNAQADEVSVAVAANFAGPLAKIAEGFSAATGHTLKASSGSTGKFHSQIVAGAPFEVLMAADDETPKRLIADKAYDAVIQAIAEARALEPALSARAIAVFAVPDASIDPFRLSLESMADAQRLGDVATPPRPRHQRGGTAAMVAGPQSGVARPARSRSHLD